MRHVLATTAHIEIAMCGFTPIDLDENLVRPKIRNSEFYGIRMAGRTAHRPTDRLCDH
jgi:hypothetical protein